jgi:hypothetical protein
MPLSSAGVLEFADFSAGGHGYSDGPEIISGKHTKNRQRDGPTGGSIKQKTARSMLAAELFEARETLVEDVQRGAITEADALIVAEGDAWDGGDLVARE